MPPLTDALEALRLDIRIAARDDLDSREAAHYLGISESQLAALRSQGEIPYALHRRRAVYDKRLLAEWRLSAGKMTPPRRAPRRR